MRRIDETFASTQPWRSSTVATAGPGARRPVNSATSPSACSVTDSKSRRSDVARYDDASGSRPATRRAIRVASAQSIGSGTGLRLEWRARDAVIRPCDPDTSE